jgi:ribosomal protein L7/L12
LPQAAVEALSQGRVVEAIRIVRQASGLGLQDAQQLVQRYTARPSPGTVRAGTGADASTAAQPASFVFPQEATTALASGDIVTAIALVRGANRHLDLRSAKEAVDKIRSERARSSPGASAALSRPARTPTVMEGDRGSHGWLLLVILAAIVACVWWLFGG